MSDPANVYALDDIRTITDRDVQPVVATAADVEQAIQKYSGHGRPGRGARQRGVRGSSRPTTSTLEAALEEAPIVKLVKAIMTQAVGDRASDVHIEPTETDVRVRFRVDGVLHEVMHSPKNIQGGLDQPPEGHGGPEHRREACAAGRPHQHAGRRQAARPACRDAADRLRREDRDPHPGQDATR